MPANGAPRHGYGTSGASYSGSWNAYGATSGTPSTGSDVPQYRYVTKEWHEDQDAIDRNTDLIAQVNAQQVALWEAERTCANKIRALYGATALHSYQSEDDRNGYGLDEIPEGTEMPWGAPMERTEGCGEATAKFVFKDLIWEGIAVGGVWGTVQGVGTLVFGYNPETGDWFSGDAYGAAWSNLGLLAASGVMNSPVLGPILWADQAMETSGGGFLPDGVRDFKAQADEAALNTGRALIAWDKWQDDPGAALGESVFNVGTLLIPVGGAAVAGVKTAGTAASVLSKMARVVDLVDPGAWAVNGSLRLASTGLGSLDNLINGLGKSFDFDLPNIDVYAATDVGHGMNLIDEFGIDPADVTARVDAAGNDVFDFPGGRIEMPAGTFDTAVHRCTTDAAVHVPAREPELVTAGGARAETGTGVVNSVVDDAPVHHETGGAGESTIVRETNPDAGGNDGPSDPPTETGGSAGGLRDGPGGMSKNSDGGDVGSPAAAVLQGKAVDVNSQSLWLPRGIELEGTDVVRYDQGSAGRASLSMNISSCGKSRSITRIRTRSCSGVGRTMTVPTLLSRNAPTRCTSTWAATGMRRRRGMTSRPSTTCPSSSTAPRSTTRSRGI
ncbi:hypothetical protein AB1K54_15860 [Microbacterium sp. BWT-B31]|uniref:hypothetical protein n=1 Tax=Microbacterium sp. BWT-B31 TaxID=3232072 RepID=UPI003526F206